MKTNLIITSLLAVVLLSGAFFSLAAAQDDSAPPDPNVIQDPAQVDAPGNSTLNQDDDAVLYARMDENNTAPQREPEPEVPGVEDANLFTAQTVSDNNLLIVAGAVIFAVVVGVLGLLCWRRESLKKQN